MNRNTIVGLVLIFGLLIGYSMWISPSKEEIERENFIRDSIAQVQKARQDSILALEAKLKARQSEAFNEEGSATEELSSSNTGTSDNKTNITAQNEARYGMFAGATVPNDSIITLENEKLRMKISPKGGKVTYVELKNYKTHDSLPLILFDGDSNYFGLSFFSDNRLINTNDLYFSPYFYDSKPGADALLKSNDGEVIMLGMRLYASSPQDRRLDEESYLEFLYTLSPDDYLIDLDIRFKNLSEVVSGLAGNIDLHWLAGLTLQEKSTNRLNGSTIYYHYLDDDVEYLSENKDDDKSIKTKLKWISYKQQFFCSSIIAESAFNNADIKVFTDEGRGGKYLRSMESVIALPYDGRPDETIGLSLYFGPLKYKQLKTYDIDLERQIPLGWSFAPLAWINRFAVIPVFDFLSSFGWNYGIIILVLTILLKLVLFPIAYKTYKSQASMRVLKPEVDAIGEKFPKKEDAMKKQQATMDLYKKAGVNPMAGCLPMLLQMPILIALFRFFPSSIELRQQAFLWATDLSSYDSILDLPFNIPFYGDHVSLFTLLMTVSTIFYTRINNQMMSTSNQMPGMKTMTYLMPVMFLGIFNNYAAGLSYYYLLANLITFAQMFLIRRFINEDKIRAKIMAHKKKPAKKSSFQKRLETMAKQQGYNPKKSKR